MFTIGLSITRMPSRLSFANAVCPDARSRKPSRTNSNDVRIAKRSVLRIVRFDYPIHDPSNIASRRHGIVAKNARRNIGPIIEKVSTQRRLSPLSLFHNDLCSSRSRSMQAAQTDAEDDEGPHEWQKFHA